ncbi:MAG: alginate export family protein [Planctomycetes bacterium]|nr:alginate export family protein [Planctomycetota bacterium]
MNRRGWIILMVAAWLACGSGARGESPAGEAPRPGPVFTWGGDLRLRYEYAPNVYQLNRHLDEERSYERYRPRVWTQIGPNPDVRLNARLVWEFYTWHHPDSQETFDDRQALFDILNVQIADVAGLPLTLTLGRQELQFGDGWLIREGTPGDGSTSYCFDAVRLSYDLKDAKTVVDAIYIQNYSDAAKYIRPFGDDHERELNDQNETGAVLYVTNQSLEKTRIEGYLIAKNDRATARRGNDARLYTYGGRVSGDLADHWLYAAQAALQSGRRNGERHEAYGFDGWIGYRWNDPLRNLVRLGYEYLSGDDPADGPHTGFDTVWARHSRHSSLYENVLALEEAKARWTNLQRVNLGWACKPLKNTQLSCDYHLLLAPRNPTAPAAGFSAGGHVRGHLATARLKHVFNKHLSTYVLVERFWPGNYYTGLRDEPATFLRCEAVVTW